MPPQSESSSVLNLIQAWFPILLVFGLSIYFWMPALGEGNTILHGDSAHHGMSLLTLHKNALMGREDILWNNKIYGGHPIFAEGQGGFLNPINIFSAFFFKPVYGNGVFHCLTMMVAGLGIFLLCRVLEISRWSSAFVSIAVVFSSLWIGFQHNMTVSGTLAWVPHLIVAMEYWMKKPSMQRAALMVIPAALLVFAGYPQLAQGTAIYLLISMAGQFFRSESRRLLISYWKAYFVTGVLAVLLSIGLSSIQLFPLMELVGESHRSQGTGLLTFGDNSVLSYLRGLLYFSFDSGSLEFIVHSLGNIAVFTIATFFFFFKLPARLIGHLLGTLLLFNLGMGTASPIFRIVYEHHLIPGFHFHRVMQPLMSIAVIGIAVVSGFVLDSLAKSKISGLNFIFRNNAKLTGIAILLSCSFLIIFCYINCLKPFSILNFLGILLLLIFFPLLLYMGKKELIPLAAVIILSLDVIFFRAHSFTFFNQKMIAQPNIIKKVLQDPSIKKYKVMSNSMALLMAFLSPGDSTVGTAYQRLLKTLSPFPGIQWGIPTIDGVTALQLGRRQLIDPVIKGEIKGKSANSPGLRLIDILGVRYVSFDQEVSVPGFSLFAHDKTDNVFIYRNDFACPRFQLYSDAVVVDSSEKALKALKDAPRKTLFIEQPHSELQNIGEDGLSGADMNYSGSEIDILEDSSIYYRLTVTLDKDAWLFLADANYPGWQAVVNGDEKKIYSAQVLGKALYLKAGNNEVEIKFVPRSFYLGAIVSGLTVLIVLTIMRKNLNFYFSKLLSFPTKINRIE